MSMSDEIKGLRQRLLGLQKDLASGDGCACDALECVKKRACCLRDSEQIHREIEMLEAEMDEKLDAMKQQDAAPEGPAFADTAQGRAMKAEIKELQAQLRGLQGKSQSAARLRQEQQSLTPEEAEQRMQDKQAEYKVLRDAGASDAEKEACKAEIAQLRVGHPSIPARPGACLGV